MRGEGRDWENVGEERGGEGRVTRTFSAGMHANRYCSGENHVFVQLYVIRLNDDHNKASVKVYLIKILVFTKSVNIRK